MNGSPSKAKTELASQRESREGTAAARTKDFIKFQSEQNSFSRRVKIQGEVLDRIPIVINKADAEIA